MNAIRVVIVDDEAMVRAGLRLLISGEPDIEVVGEAADGVEGLALVSRLEPHVVLMDVRMPRLSGLATPGPARVRWTRPWCPG